MNNICKLTEQDKEKIRNQKFTPEQFFEEWKNVIIQLGRLENLVVTTDKTIPPNSVSTPVPMGTLHVQLDTTANKIKEAKKLKSDIDHTISFTHALEDKLSNDKFVANAPKNIVENELAKYKSQISKMESYLATLRELV